MRSVSASCSGANKLASASIATRKVSNEFVQAGPGLEDTGSGGPAATFVMSLRRVDGLLAGTSRS